MSSKPISRQIALEIADRIARQHGYTLGHILTNRKEAYLVSVRWTIWAEVATLFPLASLPELGRWFNRDHASILYALRRMGVWDRHWKPAALKPRKPRKRIAAASMLEAA